MAALRIGLLCTRSIGVILVPTTAVWIWRHRPSRRKATTMMMTDFTSAAAARPSWTARLAAVADAWRRYRLFRRTYDELNALSTRELDDLGISRSMITRLAHEAAYGRNA
jgi:uncharacterized protein YjiS (DUF1127 family)